MLPERLDQVDENVLAALCTDNCPEAQVLEFKRALPERSDKGRAELLKDVCAFANADGGDLVYGIAEKGACASSLVPIVDEPIDHVKRRLSQIIEAKLEPRVVGVQMHAVTLGDGYALIVRVPASFDGPHRFVHNDCWRFVIRNGTRTSDLTYPQIRAAFDRTATLSERAKQFRIERLAALESGRTWRPLLDAPLCVVHLVPIAAMTGRAPIDIREMFFEGYAQFSFPDWDGASRVTNLDGVIAHPGGRGPVLAYVLVFRSGAFEAVRIVRRSDDEKIMVAIEISHYFREAFRRLLAAAKSLGMAGPAVVSISLLKVSGWQFGIPRDYDPPLRGPADRSDLVIPDKWVERLEAISDVDEVVRPMLDILWQCFDVNRCTLYDTNGTWIEKQTWPR